MKTYRITDNLPAAVNLRQLTAELAAIDPRIAVAYNAAGSIVKNGIEQELPAGFTVQIPDSGVSLQSVRDAISAHVPTQTEEQEAAAADLAARVQRFAALLKVPAIRQALKAAITDA